MKKTLLFACLSLLIFSCKRDELVDVVDPGQKVIFQADNFYVEIDTSKLSVYDFHDFDKVGDATGAGGDVEIINADSTLISVLKSYLSKIRDRPDVGEKLILYLNDTTILNTKINVMQDKGDRYILNVSPIPMEQIFNNLSVKASTEEYYDPSKVSKSGDKSNDWQAFLSPDGVLHPAKSMYRDQNGKMVVVDHANQAQSKWGEWGPSLNLGFDVTFKTPINIAKDDNFKFSIAPQFHVWGGLGFEVQIKWFTLKKFEAYAGGGIEIDCPIKATFHGEQKFPIYDKKLGENEQYQFFMFGVVPAIFNYKTGFKTTADISFKGKAELSTGFKYSSQNKVGVRWENNQWTNLSAQKSDFSWTKPTFTLEASANLNMFIGPYFEFGFYCVYFAEAYIGGYLDATAKASLTLGEQNSLSIGANVDAGMKAGVWAKLKVLRWEIGKWGTEWNIFSFNLFKGEWELPLTPSNAPFSATQTPATPLDQPLQPQLQPNI